MNSPELTLLFDGKCPFCAAEMARLRSWDKDGRLAFTDISLQGFDPAALGLRLDALNLQLHSITGKGEMLIGIDSMLAAYTLVGKAWLVSPLRVRCLRPLLSNLYRAFARNRYRISRWMGYKAAPTCDKGVCRVDNPFLTQ